MPDGTGGQSFPPPAAPKNKAPVWVWVLVGFACFGCLCSGVLAAILLPVFVHARNAARSAVALSNAKQVNLAMLMYANDYDDLFPPLSSSARMPDYLTPYLKEGGSDPARLQKLQDAARSYVWNQDLSGKASTRLIDPAAAWIFHSKSPDVGGKFELGFGDGHARRVNESELSGVTSKPTELEPIAPSKSKK